MNPFDFVKAAHEGSWLPIIIFLVWFAVSLFTSAQNKKKKQRQRQQEIERRAGVPEARERKPDPIEEIRRQLEDVFSGERRTSEETASMEAERPLDSTEAEHGSYETESYETEPEPARPVREKHTETAAHTYDSHATKSQPVLPPVPPPPALVASMADTVTPQEEEEAVGISLGSIEDARRGFLWSEILAPPKALRE